MTTPLLILLLLFCLYPSDAQTTKGSWTDFTGTFQMYGAASSFSYVTGTVTWSWTNSKMLLNFNTATGATWSETYSWNTTRGFTGSGLDSPQYLFTLGSACSPNCNSASISYAMPLLNPSGPSLSAGVVGSNGCYTYTPVASGSASFLTSLSASSTQVCSFEINDGRTFVMTSFTKSAAPIAQPSGCSCTQAVDIEFLIDHSLSISNDQMKEFKKFVTNFLAGLTISPTAINAGAVYFSIPSKSGTNWPITGSQSVVDSGMAGWAVPCVDGSSQCQGSGTATGYGIRIAADALYASQRQVPKILMTLTDGATNTNRQGSSCCSSSGADRFAGCNSDIDSAIAYLKTKKAAQSYAHNLTLIAAGVGVDCNDKAKQECSSFCRYNPHLLKFADGIASNVLSVNDWATLQTQVSNLMSKTCTTSNNVAQQTCLASCTGVCVCGICTNPTGCTNNTCFNYTLVNGVCRPTANPCPYQTCQTSTCDNDALEGKGQCKYSPVDCSTITSGCNGCIKYTCATSGASLGSCAVPDSSSCEKAVDCIFYDWTGWSQCTATCGGGTATATRTVNAQPTGCGASCSLSPTTTTVSCNTQSCATPCVVEDWGLWGSCSLTCGGGTRTQTRTITANATNGGTVCPALTQSQSCNSQNCPINCSWYDWGTWSPCTKTCGNGTTTQTRSIKVQSAFGGLNCSGNDTNIAFCSTNGCPVDCVWSIWGNYNDCSVTCGPGTQTRTRNQTQSVLNGGIPCNGTNTFTQNCTVVECPINCVWSSWTDYGACTQSCGVGGTKTRTRVVTTPGLYGGLTCNASDTSNYTSCNTQPCPIDCVWSLWSGWTDCTKTCAGGTRSINRSITIAAQFGGINCTGSNLTVEPCNTQGCPVNCSWSAFGAFGSCTLSCGGGKSSQYRTVNISMQNGGVDCDPLQNVNTTDCNTDDCPIDCIWKAWEEWTACSKPCGGGSQTSNRSVARQANPFGVQCGDLYQINQTCNTQNCPINCIGSFGEWSACDCEQPYTRSRTYAITVPPQFLGTECSNKTGDVEVDPTCIPVADCTPINCTGSWGGFSDCSCSTNDKYRVYTVTIPSANNGTACPNATGTKDIQPCTPVACPVNCSGDWTAPSECLCVVNTSTQMYIHTVLVLNGGVSCPFQNGTINITTGCTPQECPVDCVGDWTAWDVCSCDTKTQGREFVITTEKQFAGKPCDPPNNATKQTQGCTPIACPVNCTGFYSEWTLCDCDTNNSTRQFTRTQVKEYDGIDCASPNGGTGLIAPEVNTDCRKDRDPKCPIPCQGVWSEWSDCSCSNNQYNRSFSLTQAAQFGGAGCSATNGEVEYGTCTPVDCPVPCVGEWTEWGSCNCTTSTKEREFDVTTPLEHGGAACIANDGDIDDTGCTPTGCPVNCEGRWGTWSNCSCVTHDRTRTYTILIEKQNAGLECDNATGDVDVDDTCSTAHCPVDCDGEWSEWSTCECAGKSQTRYFQANVIVINNGQECPGNQSQTCIPVGCAVDCKGAWSEWSNCPCPASGNSSSRNRTFVIEIPVENDGVNCTQTGGSLEKCIAEGCPANCTGVWSSWSTCSCKDRIHTRVFTVTQNQSNGGNNCEANDKYVGVGACEPSGCDPRPVCNSTDDCIDSSACTQNLCVLNETDGQSHCDWTQRVECNDKSLCTDSDTCDDIKGCVYIPLDCNDNNACTNDFCSNSTGCYHENVTCKVNASDFCSTPICDVTTGCNSIQRVCPGEAKDNCTQKICNPDAKSASVACEDVQLCGFDPAVVIGIAGGAIAGIAVAAGTVALAAASGASYAIATQSGAMAGATVIESPLYVGDGTSGVNMLPH